MADVVDLSGRRARGAVDLIETLTDRVRALEVALQAAADELALRAEVDVIVAHELRTPLTVVSGVLETVAAGLLNETDRNLLLRAGLRQARLARSTVEDLMHPGVHPAQLVPRAALEVVELAEVTDDVLDCAARRGIDMTKVSLSGFEVRVTSAPARLRAILANFIENAIHSGRGPVECQAQIVDQTLHLAVSDRGPGLGGRDPEDIFLPHPKDSSTRTGLYIARMIARSLGGDAFLAERDGGGATAWVELPQRRLGDSVEK